MPKYKSKYQKTLPLKSNNNMAKELVEQSKDRINHERKITSNSILLLINSNVTKTMPITYNHSKKH